MTDAVVRRQGQPVLFLGLLIAGWLLLRVITWEDPWSASEQSPGVPGLQDLLAGPSASGAPAPGPSLAAPAAPLLAAAAAIVPPAGRRAIPLRALAGRPAIRPPPRSAAEVGPAAAHPLDTFGERRLANAETGDSHGTLPFPDQGRSRRDSAASPWRLDAWLMLREGSAGPLASGAVLAGYGGSQAGAMLAYRLSPGAPLAPAVFLRATRALAQGAEAEAALGARVRPLANLPLDVHVELRATERSDGVELRPAAYVAGGVDHVPLAAGLTAGGYLQAGYVGGNFATGFVDGKLVAEREIARFAAGSLALGGGLWGGAQRGAARLDTGPSVRLDLSLGGKPVRLAADYRWRIAGGALPGSGAALTLSTGF